ncbi:MAG: type II toxin-antitoxin system VapC family toxin [Acidobacteria bacterium]|nr:type II toxin-antitoxin system VapC family toxin [Acidobacteriota bacterium]
MRVYLDSSAILKRVVTELESQACREALEGFARDGDELVSSNLAWIEVSRTIRKRLEEESPRRVIDVIETAMTGIYQFAITDQVIDIAQRLGPVTLRSLDAIHLASANLLGVDLICGYDQRLLVAAEEYGFRTLSPGLV